jgi:predicted nucleic acid-binding protein
MAWIFPDERTDAILALFRFIAENGAAAPELWKTEVANTLYIGIRRGRLLPEHRPRILTQLQALPISIDEHGRRHIWSETLQLADKHRLTVYDATYLELALRLAMPLATLDGDLRAAAQSEGVVLLGK